MRFTDDDESRVRFTDVDVDAYDEEDKDADEHMQRRRSPLHFEAPPRPPPPRRAEVELAPIRRQPPPSDHDLLGMFSLVFLLGIGITPAETRRRIAPPGRIAPLVVRPPVIRTPPPPSGSPAAQAFVNPSNPDETDWLSVAL